MTPALAFVGGAALMLILGAGCGGQPSSAGDSGLIDAGFRPSTPDSGSAADAMTNGSSCQRSTTSCDPSCGSSCGTDPACLDICCHDSTSSGVWCNGTCTVDRCYAATCSMNQSNPWTCEASGASCICAPDPKAHGSTGTPTSSCEASSGTQCLYSLRYDFCFCAGPGSVAPWEVVVPSCTQRPSCACPYACK